MLFGFAIWIMYGFFYFTEVNGSLNKLYEHWYVAEIGDDIDDSDSDVMISGEMVCAFPAQKEEKTETGGRAV